MAAIRGTAESVTGVRPGCVGMPYGCDMALWIREGGTACVVYGPGYVSHAHAADEHVSLTEVKTVAQVLTQAVRRLLGEGLRQPDANSSDTATFTWSPRSRAI